MLFVVPLCSICSCCNQSCSSCTHYILDCDQNASAAILQFINSTTSVLPLRIICLPSALMLLSWQLNYAHDNCRFATTDYLLALKTCHNLIFMFDSKCHPVKSRRRVTFQSLDRRLLLVFVLVWTAGEVTQLLFPRILPYLPGYKTGFLSL